MRRVFTKFLGSAWFGADHTIGLKLADGLGAEEEVVVTPDIAQDMAHSLMIERARIFRVEEEGVPTVVPVGEPTRTRALRVDALEYRQNFEPDGRPVLVISTQGGAEYAFVLPREYADRVKDLASRNPT